MINNLEGLLNAVRQFTNRNENVLSNDLIKSFISLCETRIYRNLRTPANEGLEEWVATNDLGTLEISKDFIEFRMVSMNDKVLMPLSMQQYRSTQYPTGYARFGSKIYFKPSYVEGDKIELSYYEDLSGSLNSLTDTNAVLNSSPNLYLYGTVAEAFKYQQESEMALMYENLFSEELQLMNDQARNQELSGANLRIGPSPYVEYVSPKYNG